MVWVSDIVDLDVPLIAQGEIFNNINSVLDSNISATGFAYLMICCC